MPKRKKKSLRPETWHLDMGEDFWFKAFEEDSKSKDPEMEKLLAEYQKLPKPTPGKC